MKKLRIGVLMGGKSLEKEVSYNSGRTVCDHLSINDYTIIPIYQYNNTLFLLPWHFLHRGKTTDFEHRLAAESSTISWDELKNSIDFIYIAQHGLYAEDGILQGTLETLRIPYLGSKVLASALRMDKIVHKTILKNAGIVVPDYIVIEPHHVEDFTQHSTTIFTTLQEKKITFPCIVKPHNEGSSIGVSVVHKEAELQSALEKACFIEPSTKKRVLIEKKIEGMEFTCIILVDHTTGNYIPLPPTEIIPEKDTPFFDYEQKYMPGRGTKHTPARCTQEIIARIQQTCIAVMEALEFTVMARIDGFVTPDNTIVIIDPNTLSGMAPSSFIFNQAAEINMSPCDIINHIITTALHDYNLIDLTMNKKDSDTPSLTEPITDLKKRVVVLLGGASNEKETSLDSGRNVFYKLNRALYDPIPVFVDDALKLYHITQSQLVRNSTKEIASLVQESQKIMWSDLPKRADFVFIALHGGEGENGSIQGMLEMLDMPYNGSSVLASALCMNKYKTNEFLAFHGFDVPKNQLITKNGGSVVNATPELRSARPELVEGWQNKGSQDHLIVKPHNDGCSVMVQRVSTQEELNAAINTIFEYKDTVLIEEYVTGMELTVGVIGNNNPRALPPSQAVAAQGILTIEEKFLPGAGENQTPAPLPQEALAFVQRTIENVYKTVQCKGYARIDCFYQNAQQSPTEKERVVILEINTLPGLTPATCLFHQAAEIGLRPMEFIDTIINLGFEEHAKHINSSLLFKTTEFIKDKEENP